MVEVASRSGTRGGAALGPAPINAARITAGAIEAARARIRPEFLDSPLLAPAGLSRAVGARLLCKIECSNAVGSFKGRGADAFVGTLPAEVTSVVAASAGNFGLALVDAARRRGGLGVILYAAETASPAKIERLRAAGAELILRGRDFDEAKEHARAAAATRGLIFVEDGREPAIAAGAGTLAMELTAQTQPITTLFVPLGNGALLAGVGCWFRAHSPQTRVVGVCAEGAPAMALSWREHAIRCTPAVDTIADGIAVRVPVPEALADIESVVDDIVLVSDDSRGARRLPCGQSRREKAAKFLRAARPRRGAAPARGEGAPVLALRLSGARGAAALGPAPINAIRQAMRLVHLHLDLVTEPAGVVGIAAALSFPGLAQATICTPITGANAGLDQLRAWTAGLPALG